MTAPDHMDVASTPESPSPDAEAMIASLRTVGAERFDPVRFRYIEGLARRARVHQGSTRRMLDSRVAQLLADFNARFDKARSGAKRAMARCSGQFPRAADDLQRMFDAGDFKGLLRLVDTLERGEKPTGLGLLLRRLEQSVPEKADPRAEAHPGSRGELKTIRDFRQTWSKLSVGNQVSKALRQAPKNAGPINSHMLMLRSLSMMRDISPDYLNRFISYAETLLFLDQGEAEKPVAVKKPAVKKATKKSSRTTSPPD